MGSRGCSNTRARGAPILQQVLQSRPLPKKSESVRIKGNRATFVETLATDGRIKIFRVKRKKVHLRTGHGGPDGE